MPPSEIATLSLDDTAEIGALFEWAPSKVSELDPTLYQDSDKSDYAELVTTAHPVSPHFKMLQNTSVGSVRYSSPPVPLPPSQEATLYSPTFNSLHVDDVATFNRRT